MFDGSKFNPGLDGAFVYFPFENLLWFLCSRIFGVLKNYYGIGGDQMFAQTAVAQMTRFRRDG